jgi:hypothetical protein
MRVSIQAIDNMIVIDGKPFALDCTRLRGQNISAVQWYGDRGEVEFVEHKQQNQIIKSFKAFEEYLAGKQEINEPEPPTPDELDAEHRAYMERHPNARAAWDERDAAIRREAEMRAAEIERGKEALASGETAARPLPGTSVPGAPPPVSPKPSTAPSEAETKPKTKPKKK